MFTSVREINNTVMKATYRTLNGKHVYLRHEKGGTERIHRAKTVKGDLFVRVHSFEDEEKWVGPIAWGQVVVQ